MPLLQTSNATGRDCKDCGMQQSSTVYTKYEYVTGGGYFVPLLREFIPVQYFSSGL